MTNNGSDFKPNLAKIPRAGYIVRMMNAEEARCPYCGEPITLDVDATGGAAQEFVSDCEICCRPIRVSVSWDAEGRVLLSAEAESA